MFILLYPFISSHFCLWIQLMLLYSASFQLYYLLIHIISWYLSRLFVHLIASIYIRSIYHLLFQSLSNCLLVIRFIFRLFRFVTECCLIGSVLLSNRVSNCVYLKGTSVLPCVICRIQSVLIPGRFWIWTNFDKHGERKNKTGRGVKTEKLYFGLILDCFWPNFLGRLRHFGNMNKT